MPEEDHEARDKFCATITTAQVFSEDPRKFRTPLVKPHPRDTEAQRTVLVTALQVERKAPGSRIREERAALVEYNEIKHLPVEQADIFSLYDVHSFVTRGRRLKQEEVAGIRHNHRYHGKHPPPNDCSAAPPDPETAVA